MSSLVHAVRILRCFTEQEPELRLSDISRRLGLSKGNTHRLLTMLSDEGLIRRGVGSSKYRLGLGLYELGQRAVCEIDLQPAVPRMLELGRLTGETILLAVLDEWDLVYVQRVVGINAPRVSHNPRDRAPVHCTASGKVLLAWQCESEIERYIRQGLPPYSPRTITDPDGFRAALAEVRANGFAENDEERGLLVRSWSAPVRDEHGGVQAALTIAGPSQRLDGSSKARLTTMVTQAAAELSGQFRGAAVGSSS
jgi:DNA-binding IclR family transcriptional regulator